MRVLWICGLPNEVRLNGWRQRLSEQATPAWSWIMGHLPPEGVELHIMCPVVGLVAPRVDFEYAGVHWHCFKRKPFRYIVSCVKYVLTVRRFVRKLNPDLIHGWGGETGFGFFATTLTSRAVVSVQGLLLLLESQSSQFRSQMSGWHGRYMEWRERRTYQKARLLLAESEASCGGLLEYYGRKGVVVPQPLRPVFYRELSTPRNADPTFLFLGTITARKGAFDVVNAFAQVKNSNARLVIIGDGESRHEVEKLIQDSGLSSRIDFKFHCSAEEVREEMARAHFFSLPSYGDTGPNALKEAIATGLFPICYDNSGPHEYITRYCGYLCQTGDVVRYAELMNMAIGNMRDCQESAQLASADIKRDLNRTAVWQQLSDLYRKVSR